MPQRCLAVGYRPSRHPAPQPQQVEFLIPSQGAATGMLWRWTPAAWSGQTCAPLNDSYPVWISANPFNPDELLLLVDNVDAGVAEHNFSHGGAQLYRHARAGGIDATNPALWLSTDGGAIWNPVTVAQGSGGGGGAQIRIRTVEWSRATSGNWVMCGFTGTELSLLYRGAYAVGNVAAYDDNTTVSGEIPRAQLTAAGIQDDAIIAGRDGLPAYVALGETRLSRLTANSTSIRYLDSAPADRGLVGIATGSNLLYATADYRGPSPTARSGELLGNAYQSLTWATHGVYIASSGTPIVRATNLFSPSGDGATIAAVPIAGSSADSCSLIRADRQTRTAVGARLAGSSGPLPASAVTADGATWTLVPGPTDAPDGTLSGLIEVLVRGGETGITPPPPTG
jgi:hypothetical protein